MWKKINPIVIAFIFSEAFFWSAWNLVSPILAVFVVGTLPNGNVQTAAFGFTLYLLVRVIVGLFISNVITFPSDRKRMMTDAVGMILLSCCYLLIAFLPSLLSFYIFFIIAGISFGISSPAKYPMFSLNLNRQQASKTWSTYDAITFTGMGIAIALGGVIATKFGFKTLFILSSIVNLIGVIPYWIYNSKHKDHKHFIAEK